MYVYLHVYVYKCICLYIHRCPFVCVVVTMRVCVSRRIMPCHLLELEGLGRAEVEIFEEIAFACTDTQVGGWRGGSGRGEGWVGAGGGGLTGEKKKKESDE